MTVVPFLLSGGDPTWTEDRLANLPIPPREPIRVYVKPTIMACEHCGTQFRQTQDNRRFCGLECYKTSRRLRRDQESR